jgi:hypothetical protein
VKVVFYIINKKIQKYLDKLKDKDRCGPGARPETEDFFWPQRRQKSLLAALFGDFLVKLFKATSRGSKGRKLESGL